MARKKYYYYAVAKGRKTGIFNTWDETREKIDGFSGAIYKGFTNKTDAEEFLKKHKVKVKSNNKKTTKKPKKIVIDKAPKISSLEKKNIINQYRKESYIETDALDEISKEIKKAKQNKNKSNKETIDIRDIFKEGGPFSKYNYNYKKRESQVEAAHLLEKVLKERNHFLLSAETGFGKSLTFLTSSIKNLIENDEGKIVIVTSNISLQEQLYYKDIPLAIDALGEVYGEKVKKKLRPTLYKGIGNFICSYKYDKSIENGEFTNISLIDKLESFKKDNDTGDLGTVDFQIPNDVIKLITCTSDECKGKHCPKINNCYVNRHKDIARSSNIIITNYHMLFSSYLVGSSIFLHTNTIIFDEAHEIEKILRDFEATSITSNSVYHIEKRISELMNIDNGGKISEHLSAFDISRLKLYSYSYFEQIESKYRNRNSGPYIVLNSQKELPDPDNFAFMLNNLAQIVDKILEDGIDFDTIKNSPTQEKLPILNTEHDSVDDKIRDLKKKLKSLRKSCYKVAYMISAVDEILEDENKVMYIEKDTRLIRLGLKDIDMAPAFRKYFLEEDDISCVLTSATITVDDKFDYIKNTLGFDSISNPNKAVYEYLGHSPFDLANQQLWYVPKDAVAGNNPKFEDSMVEQIAEVIHAVNGGTLCLFTSTYNLNKCKKEIDPYLPGKTVLSQGDFGRKKILDIFRNDVNSSLLATKSFFTGVDIAGESLRCVVIDKLPFESPNDPVQQKLKDRANSFSKYMLPSMVISLKQAVGRGIRTINDRCVIVILDDRILSATYGKHILNSFKYKKTITRNIYEVERFIKKEENANITFDEVCYTQDLDWEDI